jgi:hypothetical protein
MPDAAQRANRMWAVAINFIVGWPDRRSVNSTQSEELLLASQR